MITSIEINSVITRSAAYCIRFGMHFTQSYCSIMLVLPLLYFVWPIYRQRHLNKTVRPCSIAQQRHFRKAQKMYKICLKYPKLDAHKVLAVVAKKLEFDGWSYELLILYVFQRHLVHVCYIAAPKLTADHGIDGVIIAKDKIYVIQSKFYTNYVTKKTVNDLAALVRRINTRKAFNNWHKTLGIPQKYTRNLKFKVIGVLATTGLVSGRNVAACHCHDVELFYWKDTIKLIRGEKFN